jgi:lysyl-tRNA synthetase class 2
MEKDTNLSENDLIEARFKHLNDLKQAGYNPFASTSHRSMTSADARELWDVNANEWSEEPGIPSKKSASIILAGRIVALRGHGGATFADIQDGFGKMQLLAQESQLKEKYGAWELFDLGDFIEVTGRLFLTKRGELTLHVDSFDFLTKSLRPLPDKWSGLEDTEKRYRERYADLIANPEVKAIFLTRSKIVSTIRQYLESNDFMEVETPILQQIAGGATAKPFITHYNAYDSEVFLRIAPELYHKRLIVGGFERVYEFAKCFRNEGVDHSHNPEFTNLEFYVAYFDYQKLMDFTEEMLRVVVKAVYGKTSFKYGEYNIDFGPKIPRISFRDLVLEHSGVDIYKEDEASLKSKLKDMKIDFPPSAGFGKLCDYLYKAKARSKIIQPIFMIDHPVELSPLAKSKDQKTVQRFQLVVASDYELCNAFSELNDPVDQKERFENQVKLKEKGDDEAQPYDADFIRALEYGMPPTAGFGMGIDRLTALLTDSNTLREVILFPYMREISQNAKSTLLR